jgi:NAD dependent epimerase/dehydratase family enzyme
LGEMSQLMLMSERVIPDRTAWVGYRFAYRRLAEMLAEACRN